jgi:hypothetical protein
VRPEWQSLNGPWDFNLTPATQTEPPGKFNGSKILVPFPYESALSGCGELGSIPDQRLWYHRTFTIPGAWRNGRRVLLHVGAVNWDSSAFINGHLLGDHRGGYDPITYDISAYLRSGQNDVVVSAWNPVSSDNPNAQVIGKQRIHPASVLYTAATGIWQTVWLEPVPTSYISDIRITPDIDSNVVRLKVMCSTPENVRITAIDGGNIMSSINGVSGTELDLPIPAPDLWSPKDPHLYSFRATLIKSGTNADSVSGYFAMRKVSLGKDGQGRTCIFLNNKYLLQIGLLDQGYWPDGIYTAPTDEAMLYDVLEAKALGFNLLRKHAKVEPDRWYFDCDRLGMLVWQDMPQMFGDDFTDATKRQWLTEWEHILGSRYNHPSIVVWTLFNEGWGQHDTESITSLTRTLDHSRLIDSGSGGYNQIVNGVMSRYRLPTPGGIGDINDTHTYPDPSSETAEARAVVTGEFGGVGMRVAGHDWNGANFSYGAALSDSRLLTRRYQQLLKEAYGLAKTQGTCAFVYTQLTDVEDETNGLMTYDRAILKPIPSYIFAANHGVFPQLPTIPDPSILIATSEETPQIWRYVTTTPPNNWNQPGFDDSKWKTGNAPFGQGYAGINTPWTETPGDIWIRRTVTLSGAIPQNLVVLVKHDEDVEVYVNGVLAASATGFVGDYARLPMSAGARVTMQPGPNVIAVHCRQTIGGQIIDVGIAAGK